MNRALCFLASLCVLALIASTTTAQTARDLVVIFDSSGSMSREDYDGEVSRKTIAINALSAYLLQRSRSREIDRAALVTFGSRYSWEDEIKPRFGSTNNVPSSSRYCEGDVDLTMRMRSAAPELWRSFEDRVRELNPQGMTPIVQAIELASEQLDATEGGTIAIVSDWDDRNCVPEGRTCAAIQDILKRFEERGGTVELHLVSTPSSPRIGELLNCSPIDNVGIQRVNPDTETEIARLLDQYEVRFVPRFTAPVLGNVEPPLAATNLTVRGPDVNNSRKLVYNGAIGLTELFSGAHSYRARIYDDVIEGRVSVTRAAEVPIDIDPAEVEISIKSLDFDGVLLPQPATVTFETARRPPTTVTVRGTDVFRLAPGTYTVTASLGGQTKPKTFSVSLGDRREEIFKFDATPARPVAQPSPRTVNLEIVMERPDLFGGAFPPKVVLASTDGLSPRLDLVPGRSRVSQEMVPGDYKLRTFEGSFRSELDLTIPDGSDPIDIVLQLAPAWLRIDGTRASNVSIRDTSGFTEAVSALPFEARVPAGRYTIEYNDPGGLDLEKVVTVSPGAAGHIALP
ncbi:MAG: vWA domain-containing protein [Pseudomonadota bacterium]